MVDELFNTALERHRSGALGEAEGLYRQVIAAAPEHAPALHNLGLLAQSGGRLQEAREWLQRAAASNPDDAACHNNLGNVLRELGRPEQALAAYQSAVRTDPNYINAYFNLAAALMDTGENQAAVDCYQQILQRRPDDREALSELGIVLMQLGRPSQAIARLQRAVQLQADDPVAHYNLGTAYREEQLTDAALASYRQALALNPGYAAAHNNVGMLLKAKGERQASARAFRDALRANPRHLPAHVNLASLLLAEDKAPEAEAQCREALEIDAGDPGLLRTLGAALAAQRRWREAAESYERAMQRAPDDVPTCLGLAAACESLAEYVNAERVLRHGLGLEPEHPRLRTLLGNVLVHQEKHEEAMLAFQRVNATSSAYAYAQDGLGWALRNQGHISASLAAYERALAARPDFSRCRSNHLFTCNYLTHMAPATLLEAHRRWARQHASHLPARAPAPAKRRADRLHVGYVSADFCRHSVAYFIAALIAGHDPERFRVSCYSNVERPDDMTARIRAGADAWRDTAHLDDQALAERVRADGVHILVDLSGHTTGNRLLCFARRPAPVQVSYLGYPNTTGLEQMDYRLTDAVADPVGEADALHSESLLRLATGFLCYAGSTDAPPVAPTPALANGHVTFASFNNVAKVNEQVVTAWARILQGVPGARLLLKSRQLDDAGARRRLLDLFSGHGIDEQRLQLEGGVLGRNEHLAAYAQVDLALDPFPYNGTTTTCEALWMGVPVIALAGQVHRGRVGASILHHAGLDELLAEDVDAYVDKALALAGDLDALGALRGGLRERMGASPLMDAEASTRDLEQAYEEMWRRHLQAAAAGPLKHTWSDGALRLNIGGSERREGWKILNAVPGAEVDYVGDFTHLAEFADASVDEVYASHVLEHIGYARELPDALGQIYRILKPDGTLRVSVPDMDLLFRLYLDPDSDQSRRWEIMRMVFGGQIDAFDYHKLGFSWDSLSWHLRQFGFRDIHRVDEFGIFDDTSSLRIGDQLISLSVQARK